MRVKYVSDTETSTNWARAHKTMTMKQYIKAVQELLRERELGHVAYVWLLTGALLVGRLIVVAVPGSSEAAPVIQEPNVQGVVILLEDMHEWMLWDLEEGKVDSSVAFSYIEGLRASIEELNNDQPALVSAQ